MRGDGVWIELVLIVLVSVGVRIRNSQSKSGVVIVAGMVSDRVRGRVKEHRSEYEGELGLKSRLGLG